MSEYNELEHITTEELIAEIKRRSKRCVILLAINDEKGNTGWIESKGDGDQICGMLWNELIHQSMSFHEDRNKYDQ